jgi:dCTP deaminase
MILTDRQIIEAHRSGCIVIDPFEEKQVQAASYDLRVGDEAATTSSKRIVNIREHGYAVLKPGDFGVVTAFESIRLDPQHTGRIGLRSKYARKGLIATTGPQIDPGFHGRLIVGLTNLTPRPISLPYKDDFLTVEFHRLEEASTKPYDGPYQGRLNLGPEEIEAIAESEGMALSEMLTSLQSLSANVGTLTGQLNVFKWVIGIGFAVLALVVAITR